MAREVAPKRQTSLKEQFAASLPWPLDAFQEEAIDKLDSGAGVLVCAPTSSGKTVVAEYAIFRALAESVQVIYTTPLKALSNQKFRDFQKVHGEKLVGLVTGENNINEQAPIVVMTTEILRNVIYEDPDRLRNVSYVILDEVHYIDDFPRGSVWEEIVIQAPAHIKLVGLSATIGNYRELADWMSQNRGRIDTVYTDRRPVELRLWLSIQNRFHPLFGPDGGVDQETWARASSEEEAAYRVNRFRSLPSNDLLHVVAELEKQRMLPAIYFIFSRRGCREALQRCAYHSLDLTTDAQKQAIDDLAADRLRALKDAGEMALYNKMVDGGMLRRGLAVRLCRQRSHALEARGIGVQSVVGQVSLEQAFVVDHGSEVLQIYEPVGSAIVFQPAIQGQDFLGRTLREKILRFRRVVMHWQDRGKHHRNMTGPRQLRH